ncbi:MAG: DUF58 domain-containing protein [Candidatus Bipolaricaulia bacterium]
MALLLDPDFLNTLERLELVIRGRFRGTLSGRRLTSRAGMSLEFAEYKEYYPGDDLRYVDWNLYGRLGKLFIKVFSREEDVPIYVFLDTSRSMGIGGKSSAAAQLAGALAYLSLKELNRVGIFPFASSLTQGVPPRGGHGQIFQIFQFLQSVEPAGETSFDASLAHFTRVRRESGVAVVISDMLSEGGYEDGLARLRYHGYEVIVLHLLAPQELEPDVTGELRLQDIERNTELPMYVDESARQAYQQRVRQFQDDLERFCEARGMRYLRLSAATPLDEMVTDALQEGAVVQ